ncbi:MAG: DUF86 domain-containing protein [Candidatus Methanoperedens sp.]|nr:DUF86 domain-containing protein [Candidatus Methanoperedens sp.]MCZ7368949.1 DUF86 domain-containing protein [Candidatus Methanoperedens sp.]
MRTEIIRTKIEEIRESLELIRENLPDSFETFASLGLVKDGMYKRIEFSIENVFDICAIINTDLRLGIPQSDGEIVEILLRNGVIDSEMKEKLKSMKGFRNIIVHRYGGIDDRLSYEFFNEKLGDFDEFIERITDFMKMQK